MRKIQNSLLTLIFVVAAVPVLLLFSAKHSRAQEGCEITVEKVAPGAEGQEFEFQGEQLNGETFSFTVPAGGSATGNASTEPVVIREVPVQGWRFGGIECEEGGGVEIVGVLPDGWIEQCTNPQNPTFCVVTNVSVEDVPTLSEWGMIAAAAGLGLAGIWFAGRRRRARVA